MVEIWYAILVMMLSAYLVLDGWNIGAGIALYAIGSDQAERRTVLRSLGPSWSWHEVWLIAFGGTLFMSFPSVYAATFAGFYFAFFLLLWSLILRGVALEARDLVDDPLWRSAWDAAFFFASSSLGFLIGISAANVLRGVPLNEHGDFALPFFTDFGVHGQVGLIDWYTLPVGLFTMLALGAHGASYIALKTTDAIHLRAWKIGRRLWIIALMLLPLVTVLTAVVRTDLFPAMVGKPAAWIGIAGLCAGAGLLIAGLVRDRPVVTFVGGSAALMSLVISAAAAQFPIMVLSTMPDGPSLNAYEHAALGHNLTVALAWWLGAAVLVVVYLVFVLKHDAHAGVEDDGH